MSRTWNESSRATRSRLHEARLVAVGSLARAHNIRPSAMERCRPVQQLSLPAGCEAKQRRKWTGGLVAGSDGALYGAPAYAAGVLRVDVETRTTSLLSLPAGCEATQEGK